MPLPERKLIARLRHAAEISARRSVRGRIIVGIGDDCAMLRLPAGHELLVTTDFSVEGVHFRRDWHPPEVVGHRCLSRGLSDIAAMGGGPVAAFLSLALPPKLPQKWVDGFLRGMLRLASQFQVTLAGGDTSTSPAGVLADIMVVGSLPAGKAFLRSGARPGDRIYVTGSLGGAAAALRLLEAGRRISPSDFQAHFFPFPRIEAGVALRKRGMATAMIDISDGLSTDLSHICEESGVGAEVWAESLPRAIVGKSAAQAPLEDVLHGGEDYELIFTSLPKTHVPGTIAGVPVTCIGEIVRGRKMSVLGSGGRRIALKGQGWEHFRAAKGRSSPV